MKQFFEQYGGVALGILALLVLIAMITPVGNIIKTSLQGTVQTFSTSINSQVDDDLDTVSKIASGIGTEILYPGNIVNFYGRNSFPNTFTDEDAIWPANYDFGDTATIYAEFKGVFPSDDYHEFISSFDSAGIGFIYTSTGNLGFQFYNVQSNAYEDLTTTEFDPSEIVRVAGVYDGSSMKLYINGELKAERSLNGNIKVSRFPIIIGNPQSGHQVIRVPNEEIYRIGVFDGALTLEQIESLQYK